MTFNSSCAFAGVANMLAAYGIDKEDREIALGMQLPYLFEKDRTRGAGFDEDRPNQEERGGDN